MKSLVLTFDDGPDVRYTPLLLNLLKYQNIPATFFIVGNHAKAHPELIRRMLSEGHTVGGHTMAHKMRCCARRPTFEGIFNRQFACTGS